MLMLSCLCLVGFSVCISNYFRVLMQILNTSWIIFPPQSPSVHVSISSVSTERSFSLFPTLYLPFPPSFSSPLVSPVPSLISPSHLLLNPPLSIWSSSHISSSPALLLFSAPADGYPLWFVLSLLDDGAKLYAGILEVFVHQHAVKELFVFRFNQPRQLLQLAEVVFLQKEKQNLCKVLNGSSRSFSHYE